MRRGLVSKLVVAVLALVAGLALAGCGGGGDDSSGNALDESLSYLPNDVTTAVVVSTDLKSEPFKEAGRTIVPVFTGGAGSVDIEDLLGRAVDDSSELSYDSEVAPLLGNPVVIGTSDPEGLASQGFGGESDVVVVFDSGDADGVRDLIDQFDDALKEVDEEDGADIFSDESREVWLALDGDVVVATLDRGDLLDALAQADRGDGFSEADLNKALGDTPRDAPLRAYADISRLREIPQVRPLTELPWFDALRTAGASVTVSDGALAIDAVANTDPAGLKETDLPLPSGDATPDVIREKGKVSGASVNQSQTTAFLLAALRTAYPDSDFVRDVEKVEKHLDIDFERQVLRQFDGPSASVLELPREQPVVFGPGGAPAQEGEFAARSKVGDPKALAGVMGGLAPDLGRLIEDLQGLQSEGLAALFLIAPDAPIKPGVLPRGSIDVETVAGEPNLYRISGLAARGNELGLATPVPDQVVFGLIGDQFVVASSVKKGKEIAAAKATPVDDVSGASVVQANLSDLGSVNSDLAGISGELSGSLKASLESLQAQLRVKFR